MYRYLCNITLATHTGTLIPSVFLTRIWSEESKRPVTGFLRFFDHPSVPLVRAYREAVEAIQLDAGGCLGKYSGRATVPILCIANKLDLIGNGTSVLNSLLLWCPLRALSLTVGPISGEVRQKVARNDSSSRKSPHRGKAEQSIPCACSDRTRKILGSFRTLRFGAVKPFHGTCHN